jgi:hypothetical protein
LAAAMRANRIDEDASDPAMISGWIATLDGRTLREWTGGFDDLVTAAKPTWPAKALAADDKRVLKDIAAVSEGGDAAALPAILPVCVARRHSPGR